MPGDVRMRWDDVSAATTTVTLTTNQSIKEKSNSPIIIGLYISIKNVLSTPSRS